VKTAVAISVSKNHSRAFSASIESKRGSRFLI
jgi:hypothetical protein